MKNHANQWGNGALILNIPPLLLALLFSSSLFAQVQLGARPEDDLLSSSEDQRSTSDASQKKLLYDNSQLYQAPQKNAPIRRREAGFVTEQISGSVSRGANRGLSRGANRGMSRGLSRGFNRGVNRGVNRSENDENNLGTAELPKIIAPIAPQHTGWSSHGQPTLYWYLSDNWPGQIYFTINEVGHSEPLLETQLSMANNHSQHKPGMQLIDLAQYDLNLKLNTEYEWFVFIIVDPRERSADFLASATLLVKAPTAAQKSLFGQADNVHKYHAYAQQGYWYDAISALSQQIDRQPTQVKYRQFRAQLLEQVKMPLVAEYDKNTQAQVKN